ncbi:MAG: SH3 domain-containing protein [Christensenellales bacterium]
MIQAEEAIRAARGLIGTSYETLDCINLIKKVIRTAPGGDKNYTTAGTNDLWNSDSKSAKYRDLTWKQEGISGAKAGMLAFMGVGTGDVDHTGLVTERGTVIHSSKSRGCVVETELTEKRGWNGLGVHRMIEVAENADAAPTGTAYVICAQTGLRMRKRPDVRGEYMQMLPDGAVIVALETRAGWIKTTYKGYTGWVSGEYCCKAGDD